MTGLPTGQNAGNFRARLAGPSLFPRGGRVAAAAGRELGKDTIVEEILSDELLDAVAIATPVFSAAASVAASVVPATQ